MTGETLWKITTTYAGLWAFLVALGMACDNLNLLPDKRKGITRWLLPPYDRTWNQEVVAIFDYIYSAETGSLKRFRRSTITSFLAIAAVYALLSLEHPIQYRYASELQGVSWGQILFIALVVNVFADWVSLWETRLILGWLADSREVIDRWTARALSLIHI